MEAISGATGRASTRYTSLALVSRLKITGGVYSGDGEMKVTRASTGPL